MAEILAAVQIRASPTSHTVTRRLATLVLLLALVSCRRTPANMGPEDAVPTTVAVSPVSQTFTSIGESRTFSATVLDQTGNPVASAAVSWETTDATVIIISPAGVTTSVGTGTASVVARSGTISGSADAIVSQLASTLVLSTPTLTLRGVGDSAQVGVEITDLNGNPVALPNVTWATSDSTIATVGGDGTVTAVAVGTTTVFAMSGQVADTATVSVVPFVPTADLQLTKMVTTAPTTFGDTVGYSISATNLGPDEATGVVLRDSLPPGLTYLSHTTSTGTFDVVSGLWTVGTIAVNDTIAMTLNAVVTGSGIVANSVSVESQDQADTVVVNDVSTASTPVAPDTVASSLQMSVDDPAPFEGDIVTFTLTYQNSGPDGIPDVDVEGALPAGLTLVSASTSNGSYADPIWSIPALALNTPATLLIAASVDASVAGQSLTHIAWVVETETHFDAVMVDDTASATTAVAFPPLAVTTSALPNGAPSVAYDQTLTATGGDGSYTWAVTIGTLPSGLSLNGASGQIAGVPTGSTESFTVTATSGDGQSDDQALSIAVNPALNITTTSLSNGVSGSAYSGSVNATGGDGNNTWSVSSGALPNGMTLNASTGSLTGTPGSNGTFNFTVQLVSGDAQTDTQSLQISVFTQLQITTTAPLPNACCGGTYQVQLQATGGAPGYTWSLASGSLPAGWSLSSSGLISGRQFDANGPTFNFIVRLISGDGQSVTRALSVSFVIG
jgi:uncharacterized repeat protein (TIGR01451 family)